MQRLHDVLGRRRRRSGGGSQRPWSRDGSRGCGDRRRCRGTRSSRCWRATSVRFQTLPVERGRPLGLAHFDLDAADAAHCGLHFKPQSPFCRRFLADRGDPVEPRGTSVAGFGWRSAARFASLGTDEVQEDAMRANRAAARAADRAADIADRVVALDWSVMAKDLDAYGCAVTAPLLTPDECEELAALYPADAPFRSRVIMARHGFGRGEYKYFAYPLPEPIAELRTALYPLAGRNRQPLERGDGHRGPLSGEPPRLSGPLPQGRPAEARRRCCCSTVPATTTACTRTSTASMCFRCRRRCCCRSRTPISTAASSC